MKFLPLPGLDIVTTALNFDTPDCHVTGGCDLYTTKAAGTDKKLYKDIDKSLESQHAALLNLGASLSPSRREEMAASVNLSRSSPFGNLADISSRRTFAYLIATLNASHPDYDFSHVLRPADFKRERNLRKVMSNLDSTLSNARPRSLSMDSASPRSHGGLSDVGESTAPHWGAEMWSLIDKEMMLQDCTVFSYQPADDPFEEEEGAIWSLHYFFFSKALKRVTYLYVRGVPVVSHSPRLRPFQRAGSMSHSLSMSPMLMSSSASKRGGAWNSVDEAGTHKRARYWLGDRLADRVTASAADDDDGMDDGLLWNRDADGNFVGGNDFPLDDDDEDVFMYEDDDDESEEPSEDDDDENDDKGLGAVRGVSEDIAARMSVDVEG